MGSDFAARLLEHYADGTLDGFLGSCQNPYTGCEGVKLTPDDATRLLSAIKDGFIDAHEANTKLTFLPRPTLNAIAGDDGKEPLRRRMTFLLAGLAKADLKDAKKYIDEIAKLDLASKDQFLPAARTLLTRLIAADTAASARYDALRAEREKLVKAMNKYESGEIESNELSHRQYKATSKRYSEAYDELTEVEGDQDTYERAFKALITYLGNLNPPPSFLVPTIVRGIDADKTGNIAFSSFETLKKLNYPGLLGIARKIHHSWALLELGTAEDIRHVTTPGRQWEEFRSTENNDVTDAVVQVFNRKPRPELEQAVVNRLSSSELVSEYLIGRCSEEIIPERMAKINDAMKQLSFTSLKAIVESRSLEPVSVAAIKEMGSRFRDVEALAGLLTIAMQDEARFPMAAVVATGVLAAAGRTADETKIKIVNGEIKVKEEIRAAFIKACDPAFYHSNLGNFSRAGLEAIVAARGANDSVGDSAMRLLRTR